jgi:hypothetical protein
MNVVSSFLVVQVKRILQEVKDMSRNKSTLFTAQPLEVSTAALIVVNNCARATSLSGISQLEVQEVLSTKVVSTMERLFSQVSTH